MPDVYKLHRLSLTAPGEPLFTAIAAALPELTKTKARQAILAGLVKLDGNVELDAKRTIGDKPMRCDVDLRHGIKRILQARKFSGTSVAASAVAEPFTVLHSDLHLLVVNKAAGILSSPPRQEPGEKPVRGHLPELIRRMFRKQGGEHRYLGVVHRLDQDTSGCICFALTREAHRLLGAQFAGEAAGRTYRCMVSGQPRKDQDTLRGVMTRDDSGRRRLKREGELGKEAITHFQVLKRFSKGCEIEARLETGRTHQIRVSLGAIGCPVYGDRVYHHRAAPTDVPLPKAPRLMLHAWRLELDHPHTGKRMTIEAPVPREFTEFAKVLA